MLNQMVIDAMKSAVLNLSFNIQTNEKKPSQAAPIDFDSLIHTEQLKLERAKQAYQAGVDSLNEYRIAKEKIEKQIERYQAQKTKYETSALGIDLKQYARTVTSVIEIIENPNVDPELKNKALRSVLQKIVFYKPGKTIELFFYL